MIKLLFKTFVIIVLIPLVLQCKHYIEVIEVNILIIFQTKFESVMMVYLVFLLPSKLKAYITKIKYILEL